MPGITYTHRNLQISEHCRCQIDCCKNTKTKTFAGYSNQRHKIKFRAFLFRKMIIRLKKTWKETNPHRKTQNVKDPDHWIGENREGFRLIVVLLPAWMNIGIQKCFSISNREGRWNTAVWGKSGCFLQENLKNIFLEMVFCPFWISHHYSNPPFPYP